MEIRDAFRRLFAIACAVSAVAVRAVDFPNPAAFNPTWESAKPGTSYSTDLPTAALLGNGSLGAVNGGDGNHKKFVLTRGDIWSCGDFTCGKADHHVRPISFADFSIGPGMHSVKSTDTLDLPTATLRTEGGFGKGRVKIETYVASTEDLLVVTGVSDADDNWAVHLTAHRERKPFPIEVKSSKEAFYVRRSTINLLPQGDPRGWTTNATAALNVLGMELENFSVAGEGHVMTWAKIRANVPFAFVVSSDPSRRFTWNELAKLKSAHDAWWKEWWNRSRVTTGDAELDRFYHGQVYLLGAGVRSDKFPPGLYGIWVTTDNPKWHNDFHMNYNYVGTYYGCFAANRCEVANAMPDPLIAYLPRAIRNAKEMLPGIDRCRGRLYKNSREFLDRRPDVANGIDDAALYPVALGPWGAAAERDAFLGQISDGAFQCAVMCTHWEYTLDRAYLKKVWPVLDKTANFFLKWCEKEATPDGGYRYNVWDSHWEGSGLAKNSAPALGCVKHLFETLVDVAPVLREMGIDVPAAKLVAWKDMHEHLSPLAVGVYPINGKPVKMLSGVENVDGSANPSGGNAINLESVIPGEQFAFDVTDEFRALATNAVNGNIAISPKRVWSVCNQTPKLFATAIRTGYPAQAIIDAFKKHQLSIMQKNFHIHDGVHGVEKIGAMEFVQSMLIQCDHGFVKVFPNWTGADAKFENLRAKGCFLVSAEMKGGKVVRVEVKSEKGGRFRIVDPGQQAYNSKVNGWMCGKTRNSGEATLERDFKPGETAVLPIVAGTRPYELDWANRVADDRPVLLPLVSADGWTCRASSATGALYTASERVLFGDGVMHLAYRMTGANAVIRLVPPAPVPVPHGFDTVSLWTWGNHAYYVRNPAAHITLFAEFTDSDGKPFSILVHSFNHSDWFLAQKRLPPDLATRVAKGATFTGFTVRGGPEATDRWIEFTSFAAYKEEMKPLSFKPRRKRGVQVFPNAPQGLNTGDGRLPFPNVETTIVPVVAEDPAIEFKLPKDPTNWDDLAVRYRNGPWMRFAKGGGLFPAVAAKDAKVRFHRLGNSLVADIEASAGVKEVRFGALAEPGDARSVPLPYYTYGAGIHRRPSVIATKIGGKPFFMLASIDWTQSNASEVFASGRRLDGLLASNGGVRYLEKTDGARNPVFERLVWSFGPKFEEVLPVIPNPPSPLRAVTAERQWAVMFAHDRAKDKAFWRNRRRRGIVHVCVNDHEVCMRDDNESFTFRTRPAPRKGGDEGMRDFTRFMIDELGYLYGPYNNYTDFAPVNGWWHADRVTRRQDGNLLPAWNRCYAPKPAFINEACEEILPVLQRKFSFNTAYCDVHTCVMPWARTDYDARVPGAGTFAATFYAYGELLDYERRVLGGPVWSEGGCHFMYCGLADGNYAQDQTYLPAMNPWLVDFDLLRLHPLANNFGMGSPDMFYPRKSRPADRDAWIDRFLAATVAFGHPGFFVKGDPANEDQSYFMLIGTGRHYCKADAKEIRYADAAGNLLDTSAAVASGIYRRSQVAVKYTDGTQTAANGSADRPMAFKWNGRWLVLPPNGFFAHAGDGSACVVSGAMWKDGGRLDLSVAPEYAYFNAHGTRAVTPFGGTDGRMYRLLNGDGMDEVFLCKGSFFMLPYVAVSVTALDEAGKEIGPASFTVEAGRTLLARTKGAFSYRVAKPVSWHEPKAACVVEGYLKPVGYRLPPKAVAEDVLALPSVGVAGQALRGRRETEFMPENGGEVSPDTPMTVGGVMKLGISMHPPYKHGVGYVFLRYALDLPKDKDVFFSTFVGKPDFKLGNGDGTLYQVAVQPAGTDISARKILASAQVKEKKWHALEADLSPWRGKKVWLYLIADVGPSDSSDCDASAWGDMKLKAKIAVRQAR